MPERSIRVPISSGTVEGIRRDGVLKWRSIPFARPPVGPLRLRAPQPVVPWRGVRDCREFAACAPQRRRYTMTGVNRYQRMSEDCLTLNVVVPDVPFDRDRDEPLPVMFFVHGGGYMLGSSATPLYDGAAMARRGCVYVSANYRLGALGCMDLSSLSTAEHPIDGNLFLRDLVAALRWVQDNIAAFGGDPQRVTVFGESAGAHAVSTLLAVPEAAGLFAGVIAESPASGMCRSADAAADFAHRFAELLGAGPGEAAETVKTAEPWRLVKAVDQLIAQGADSLAGSFAIGPAVDGHYLPEDPIVAMARGDAHRVPLIVGHNAEEGRLFTRWLKLLPMDEAVIEKMLADVDPVARERITAAYPGYPSSSACVRLGADMCFSSSGWHMGDAHSRHAPTYLYRYDYAPRVLHWSGLGATHATELFAVFDAYRGRLGSMLTMAGDRRSALRVSNEVQRRWRSFARTADPGPGWPRYDQTERAVMIFDRRSRVELDPTPARREAWQGFSLTR